MSGGGALKFKPASDAVQHFFDDRQAQACPHTLAAGCIGSEKRACHLCQSRCIDTSAIVGDLNDTIRPFHPRTQVNMGAI